LSDWGLEVLYATHHDQNTDDKYYHGQCTHANTCVTPIVLYTQVDAQCDTELSTGPFCVTRSNSTHQLTDPTHTTHYK